MLAQWWSNLWGFFVILRFGATDLNLWLFCFVHMNCVFWSASFKLIKKSGTFKSRKVTMFSRKPPISLLHPNTWLHHARLSHGVFNKVLGSHFSQPMLNGGGAAKERVMPGQESSHAPAQPEAHVHRSAIQDSRSSWQDITRKSIHFQKQEPYLSFFFRNICWNSTNSSLSIRNFEPGRGSTLYHRKPLLQLFGPFGNSAGPLNTSCPAGGNVCSTGY